MVVMNAPGGTMALRVFSAAIASGMVKTCSSGVCHPGRLPTRTMWSWASMSPGMTVLPLRSTTLALACGHAVADSRESAVADQQLRDNAAVPIHRVDPAIDQDQVSDVACGRRLPRLRVHLRGA